MQNTISYKFPKQIYTNAQGFQILTDFYHYCHKYKDCWITIDWSEVQHMDANLSALLLAMIHKLKQENKIKFYLDYQYLRGPMNIFWRNGLAHYIYKTDRQPNDDRSSTIPVRAFKIDSVDKFVEYIENDLLKHRGVDSVTFHDKNKVKDSYFEIFNNYEIHAGTQYPLIACGQLFPKQQELKFTLVDMGAGFLQKIKDHTKDLEKPVTTSVEAINWAIKGNSTKVEAAGGTGLKKILFYCMKGGGSIHIASDGCYWAYDGTISNYRVQNPVVGTTIHLIFRYN